MLMNELELLKANLGISSTSRDDYLTAILTAASDELTRQKGIDVETETGKMFLIDYAAWLYRNRGEGILPRNLQYRMHNLMVNSHE